MGGGIQFRVADIVSCLLLLFSSVHSAPRDFRKGDALQVKVKKISSTEAQLPYDYYFMKYSKPSKIQNVEEDVGEVVRCDRLEDSIYSFRMRSEMSCRVSRKVRFDAQVAKDLKEKIDDEFLDGFPVAVVRQNRDGNPSTTYEHGFRVGFKGTYAGSKEEKYFIHNHLSFRVMYHSDPETGSARIVGFEVSPNSIKHEYKAWDANNNHVPTCNENNKNMVQGSILPQEVDKDQDVIFTYDVTFKESDVKLAPRWDTDKPLITKSILERIWKIVRSRILGSEC